MARSDLPVHLGRHVGVLWLVCSILVERKRD